MTYRRCGRSGLLLPAVSLGLWQNFGDDRPLDTQRAILRRAFDLGITHFDLANNYGPPYGSAETNFARILHEDFRDHRDELVISTKAGWDMWPGPYGDLGSRKYLLASLDQSLRRLGLDYVDIFYHHHYDPQTPSRRPSAPSTPPSPLARALYVGISSYSDRAHRRGRRHPPRARHPAAHPPAVVLDAQPLDRRPPSRRPRHRRRRVHRLLGLGARSAHRPVPQRHSRGFPGLSRRLAHSRHAQRGQPRPHPGPQRHRPGRGQSLAQMAIAWALRDPRVTSVLIGASSVAQLEQNVAALDHLDFTAEELATLTATPSRATSTCRRGPATA